MNIGQTAGMVATHTFTIAKDASLSAGVYVGGARYFGIVMPAAWTEAAITFQVSPDGTTYQDLLNDGGTEVSVTAAAADNIGIATAATALAPWAWVKIRSGTSASAVTQAAARTLYLVTKG